MKIKTFTSDSELIDQTENLLRTTLAQPGHLMLSGGSTPYVVYNRIAAHPSPLHPERTFFMGDERMVPPDSDKNNFHNLQPMIQALGAQHQCFGPNTSLAIEAATADFEKKLAPIKTIDLALLGIGTDGHTCGFFTLEQANLKSAPLALFTDRPDGMQGVSATAAVLKRVQRILVLAPGESKRDILQTLSTAPNTLPIGVALSDHPNAEVWTDRPL